MFRLDAGDLELGASDAPAGWSFRCQGSCVAHGRLDPPAELILAGGRVDFDLQPAADLTSVHNERARPRIDGQVNSLLGAYANEQTSLAACPESHMASQHEGYAAENGLLNNRRLARYSLAQAIDQIHVIRHGGKYRSGGRGLFPCDLVPLSNAHRTPPPRGPEPGAWRRGLSRSGGDKRDTVRGGIPHSTPPVGIHPDPSWRPRYGQLDESTLFTKHQPRQEASGPALGLPLRAAARPEQQRGSGAWSGDRAEASAIHARVLRSVREAFAAAT